MSDAAYEHLRDIDDARIEELEAAIERAREAAEATIEALKAEVARWQSLCEERNGELAVWRHKGVVWTSMSDWPDRLRLIADILAAAMTPGGAGPVELRQFADNLEQIIRIEHEGRKERWQTKS